MIALDYSAVYFDQELAEFISRLERTYKLRNEEDQFESLVNMSTSNDKPYHRWAKYREGYSGELVRELIVRSQIHPDKHFVYDPMCGSGSTLLASIESGFDVLGSDISPYAVDVTQVKIEVYEDNVVREVEHFMFTLSDKEHHNKWKNLEELQPYFSSKHLHTIQNIGSQIHAVNNSKVRQLLFVAWLMILEDASNRKKDGNGLATRPSPIENVWQRYVEQLQVLLEDIEKCPLPSAPKRKVVLDSAMAAPALIQDFTKKTGKELGAIIFSPPYANSFDYFESYKLELLGGYFTTKELIQAREKTIRSYRKGYRYELQTDLHIVEMLCREIRHRVPQKEAETGRKDNRSRLVPNLLVGYFEDMRTILRGFAEVAHSGTYCHIVVDQSAYLGAIVPTDIILAHIGEMYGFEVQEIVRCRGARTSPQQLAKYPYLKSMLRESIVSLRKL